MEKMGMRGHCWSAQTQFFMMSLTWPLEPGELCSQLKDGGCRARWMEWAIAMQTGQQKDKLYGDRWGRSGRSNTKTKRQIGCMALSSGGQIWLKQTRQMRREATFKHELLMTWQVLPQKLCDDANKVDFTRNACQTVTMQYLVTVRGQYRQFLSKCGLHTRSSLQA